MFKNVATKIALFAFDTTTGAAKTGDAANITAYVSKDYGTVTVLGDTSATEMDSTNAKGWYLFDLAQAETNADALLFTGKSSTSNIAIVGQYIFTTPNRFTTLVIDAAGLADANMVKAGPTGSGTAQTASDHGAALAAIRPVTDKLNDTLVAESSPANYKFSAAALSAVWDTPRSFHVTAGTFGEGVGSVQGNVTGSVGSVTGAVGSVTGAVASVTGNVGGNVVGTVASVVGAVGSVTGNVGGNVTGSVGSVASGGITASSFATNAIDANALASSAVTEIQTGLSTLDAAAVRSAVGLASANLDTQLGMIAGYIDTEVSAIKSVTDKLFTMMVSVASPTDYVFTAAALQFAPSGSGPSAASIASAVWEESTASHATAGTTGKALTDAGSAGNPWSTVLEGTYTAEDLLRIIAAQAAGKTTIVETGAGTATVTFRDLSDASDIIVGHASGSQRVSVTLNP